MANIINLIETNRLIVREKTNKTAIIFTDDNVLKFTFAAVCDVFFVRIVAEVLGFLNPADHNPLIS